MGLLQLTTPAVLPVTLAELRAHCRIDLTADDAELLRYLRSAVASVERDTGRQLVSARYRYSLASWPTGRLGKLKLPRAPLQAVSRIRYLDQDGDRQTLSALAYATISDEEPGAVLPVYGDSWPSCRVYPGSIEVEYWAGCAANVTDVTDDVLTAHGPAVADGDEIVLWTPGDLPSGLDAGRLYYARDCSTSGAATEFALSLSDGGAALTGLGDVVDSLWLTTRAELFTLGRQAVLLLAAHLYEAREATTTENVKEIPLGAQRLLEQLQYGAELYDWETV